MVLIALFLFFHLTTLTLMPTILDIRNLTIPAPHKILCDQVEFSLNSGAKVALVAKNGAGKSSLLRVIAGIDEAYDGEIKLAPRITLWYLSQDEKFAPHETVLDTLFLHDSPEWQAIKSYEHALATNAEDIETLVTKIEELNAWDYESRVNIVINQLKLHEILERKIEHCSGGEIKRVALARVLIDDPDLLILDEPTNHLDVEMIERLEVYLSRSKRTLLLVTHDRYFLERVCDQILELDQWHIHNYPGNYSKFLELKQKREDDEAMQRHQLKQVMRKELEWIRKAPRARENKSSFRTKAYYELEDKYKSLKRTDRKKSQKIEIDLAQRRLGGKILRLHNVYKSFGDKKIVDNYSYDFRAWERVGLIGHNGVGKSSFIQLLMWSILPDSGDIRRGDTIQMALYEQKQKVIDESKTVLQLVKDKAEYITIGKGQKLSASQLLDRFLFWPKQQHQKAYTLSGWERRRLHLLQILITNPNFLILDEPTNDLDIHTLQVLEDFLLNYKWCLVIVSHDRFFVDKVVDHLMVFEWDWIITEFPGNYSDYRYMQDNKEVVEGTRHSELVSESSKNNKNIDSGTSPEWRIETQAQKKKSLSNKEREEYKMLSSEIERLETRKEEINLELASGMLDHVAIKTLSTELAKLVTNLDTYESRWLELEERV